MPLSNTHTRYGGMTKFFHWTTAALILALIPLGVIANKLPYETSAQLADKAWLFSLHKTLGVAVFFVALLRILWACTQIKPGALHPDRKTETMAAEVVHWVLYGALVIAPLSGWIHHAATSGFAPIWWPFGQNLPLIPKDETLAHMFGSLHWVMTKVLAVALFVHVAGALKHVFIDKDATLRRMWFGKADVPDVAPHRSVAAAPIAALAIFVGLGGATLALDKGTAEGPQFAALAATNSAWAVQDGTLAITIIQLGGEVTGNFSEWSADITFDPATKTGDVTVTIAIGSLTLGSVTDQAMGADFFDVDTFPTATFTGPITHVDANSYESAGTLTMKGTTLPLQFVFDLDAAGDIWTMRGTASITRLDYGIGASMPEADSVGHDVVVNAELTAIQVSE